METVFHAPTAQPGVLRNTENLLDDETIEMESVVVVAHGDGLDLVVSGGKHAGQVSSVLERGVDIAACRNTMARRGPSEAELVEGVRVVSSGVGELTRLQARGFAYIRP